MRIITSNPKPQKPTASALLAALLAGGLIGIILSALAVMATANSKLDIEQDQCYSNPAGLTVRVLDVNYDTVTYGGWQADRFYVWARGAKHFEAYYKLDKCLQ